jgi:hypothetical protein
MQIEIYEIQDLGIRVNLQVSDVISLEYPP